MGLVEGIKKAIELNIQDLIIKGDSLLVIKQLNGSYNVNSENLKPLYQNAHSLTKNIKRIQYIHIKREMNAAADKLANIAMDNK